MKVIEFIVDKLEYLIAIGVFGYGLLTKVCFMYALQL